MDEVDEVEEFQDLQEANFEGNNKKLLEKVDEPKVRMCFNSPDEMFGYYKAYNQKKRFPVMQRSCKKGDNGSMRYVTFI